MFDSIKNTLQRAFRALSGNNKITEGNISEVVKSIRRILTSSDVNYNIAKEVTENIKNEAIGTKVINQLNPEQVFTKIVYDKLVDLMSCGNHELVFSNKTLIVLLGLQGAGKTTLAGKLSKYISSKYKKKPLLVACDVYRPAAIEQLETTSRNNNLDFFKIEGEKNVNKIIDESIKFSIQNGNDTVIIDTAGRQTVDDKMMEELKGIFDNFNITESLLVLDGMIGQTSLDIAKRFNETVKITGAVLTKMDGDSNGGVALSLAKSINKPIKFISTGENINDLEEFHPSRIANRILGKGDVITLVEKIKAESEKIKEDTKKGRFDYTKLQEYVDCIINMGDMKSFVDLLPISANIDESSIENNSKYLKKIKPIINSMTLNERKGYIKLDLSRKIRISKGSGTSLEDVNKTIKLYEKLFDMQNKLKGKSITQLMNSIKNLKSMGFNL